MRSEIGLGQWTVVIFLLHGERCAVDLHDRGTGGAGKVGDGGESGRGSHVLMIGA